jgi:hypothetical protein
MQKCEIMRRHHGSAVWLRINYGVQTKRRSLENYEVAPWRPVTPAESRVFWTERENAAAPTISPTRDVNDLSLRKIREAAKSKENH